MQAWLMAMLLGSHDVAGSPHLPDDDGTKTTTTAIDEAIVNFERQCAARLVPSAAAVSSASAAVSHTVLANTQPLVQWLVLVDVSTAARDVVVVQQRPRATDPTALHSLTVNQLRSILKFIGVKPQNASMASNLVLNTLVLDAVVPPPPSPQQQQLHAGPGASATSASAAVQRGRRGQASDDDLSKAPPAPPLLRLMRTVNAATPAAPSSPLRSAATNEHIVSMHALLHVEQPRCTPSASCGCAPPQPPSFFVEVSTAHFARVVRTILLQEKHIASSQPPMLRPPSSPPPLMGATTADASVVEVASGVGGASPSSPRPNDTTAALHGSGSVGASVSGTTCASTSAAAPTTTASSRRQLAAAAAYDLRIAFCIRMQQRLQPLVVLVGGTSGCGKSTLAHLLANRLGIATVISTDGVRELLRSRRDPVTCPELFASTYEAHLAAGASAASSAATAAQQPLESGEAPSPIEPHVAEGVYTSFERQATHVLQVIDVVLKAHIRRGDSVLVEGVHLLPDYAVHLATSLAAQGVLCIPMVVHIVNAEKHLLRFAIRSKSMTLKPQENKYVSHFASIRCIQQRLVDAAKLLQQQPPPLPPGDGSGNGNASHVAIYQSSMLLVNNTNVDKSLSTIHFHVLRMVDRMIQQQQTATIQQGAVGVASWMALTTFSSSSFSATSTASGSSGSPHSTTPPAGALGGGPLPLHSVKGKDVVTLLMQRREEKRQRRARSAEVVIGGSGGTPGPLLSPPEQNSLALASPCGGVLPGAVSGASSCCNNNNPTVAGPHHVQQQGRPPLHHLAIATAGKVHGMSPPLGPTTGGTSPSSLSAHRSLSADASDPRRRYGGGPSAAKGKKMADTMSDGDDMDEDEGDHTPRGSGSADSDHGQGEGRAGCSSKGAAGGRSSHNATATPSQPHRLHHAKFVRTHKRNMSSSGADDDDEVPSLVGS